MFLPKTGIHGLTWSFHYQTFFHNCCPTSSNCPFQDHRHHVVPKRLRLRTGSDTGSNIENDFYLSETVVQWQIVTNWILPTSSTFFIKWKILCDILIYLKYYFLIKFSQFLIVDLKFSKFSKFMGTCMESKKNFKNFDG